VSRTPSGPRARRAPALLVLAGAAALVSSGVLVATPSQAATACSVTYTVASAWGGGFVASVDVSNTGDAISGWKLTWTFPASGQSVTSAWNASVSQSGATVTAADAGWNANLASGATTSFGFQGAYSGSNPVPTSFALNGTRCGGGGGSTSTSSTTSSTTRTSTSTSTTTRTSTSSTSTSSGGGTGTSSSVVHGYATVSGSTTGGGSAAATTVTSLSALTSAASGSSAAVIKVSGNFSCSGDVKVASNKTIIGVGSSSGLTGCGLSLKGVSNVILRNLKIAKVQASSGNGDAIHIESGAKHTWVDHNDLSSDTSHGTDYYDGLLDITHAADYITVSWNKIHDHVKCSLIGHSDSNGSEDKGHLHVTYDHNYFYNCDQRTPSLRFGTGHVYNNYFDGASTGSTGIHSRMGAQMLVQNNVFRNVKVPIETTKDSSQDGYVNQSGNDFGGGANLITQTGSFTSAPYSAQLDATSSVVGLVTAGAGTGKVG
jgi:pectate lyase